MTDLLDHFEAAARPGRGQKSCDCCHGSGEHADGHECYVCDASGSLGSSEHQDYCEDHPPRRRHWREAMTRCAMAGWDPLTEDRSEHALRLWAKDKPHTAITQIAQAKTAFDHPRMHMSLPEPENDEFDFFPNESHVGGKVMQGMLQATGFSPEQTKGAFVVRHPEGRSASNAAFRGHRMGAALHPLRWDYGTLAHESAHHWAIHKNAWAPNDHSLDDADIHGRDFTHAYSRALEHLSPGAGDDYLRHYADASLLVSRYRARVHKLPGELPQQRMEFDAAAGFRTLYHGTSREAAEGIRQNGIASVSDQHIYPAQWPTLTENRTTAEAYSHDGGAVVELHVPHEDFWEHSRSAGRLWPAQDHIGGNAYAIRKDLPASYVAAVHEVKKRPDYPHEGSLHQAADRSYEMRHQGPDDDDGEYLHELGSGKLFPEDVLEHPERYQAHHPETVRQIRSVHGDPEAKVSIYRALPEPHRAINKGDWVGLSAGYARQHAESEGGRQHGYRWPVIRAQVPAKHLNSEANSLEEWTYQGPDIPHAELHDPGTMKREAAQMLHLWHHTSPKNASAIYRSGQFNSEENDEHGHPVVFFSNVPFGMAKGYGAGAVHLHVPEHLARLEDEFPSGEQHYSMRAADIKPEHFRDLYDDDEQQEHWDNWRQHNASVPQEDWEENLRRLRYRKRNEPLMHRGMAVELPPEVHDFVHDQFQSRDRQARTIMEHLSQRPLGMHWSTDEQTPRHFADWERKHNLPGSTKVILHAALPDVEHIETDPARLREGAVYRHDSWMTPEHEIPMKEGAPVNVKAVTWYGHGNRKRTGYLMGHVHEAALQADEPAKISWEDRDRLLHEWFGPKQEGGEFVKHPRSGWQVEKGIHRHLDEPVRRRSEGWVEEPARMRLTDHGDPEDPSYNSLEYMMGKPVGHEPVTHVYRGVSRDEWHQAQQRGYLHSDQRGTIDPREGTNAAVDPSSAWSYLPHNASGHILKIRVHPEDKWFTIPHDNYVRTREKIPLDRVEGVSPLLTKDDHGAAHIEHQAAAIPNGQLKLFHMEHERRENPEERIPVHRGLFFGMGTHEEAEDLHRHPFKYLNTKPRSEMGIHWTDDENSAYRFAQGRDAEGWADDNYGGEEDQAEGKTHRLGMVLHGEVHPRHVIQPGTDEWENYAASDAIFHHEHPEQEVTVRAGAPVHIHEVTTTSVDPEGYERERHHAYGQRHTAAVDESLPFMRQPAEEELPEHLERRHGMDREQQVLYDAPGHWKRWHDAEHFYLTRNDHQHAVPHGHPLEEKYPAAHVIPDDASDVAGVSGGHSTRPWHDVRKTGPFYPTDLTHYSARAWTPHERIFGPTYGLDHRLFDENGELRPEVRAAVLERMDQAIRVDSSIAGTDQQDALTLYLAGSEASEWTGPDREGNGDFDVLVDIDYDAWRGYGNSSQAREPDEQITVRFNQAMRRSFNDEDWHPEFGGTWHLTGYCNGRPITEIRPYAAWNITDSRWVVQPPHLPEHSAADFPPALLAEARAVASQLRAILKLEEPYRSQQARSLWQHIHDMRSEAFSPSGAGWQDPGNVIEKYLDQHPHRLMDKLRVLVFAKAAVLYPDPPDYEHGIQSGGSQVEWVKREKLTPYLEFDHNRETGMSTHLPTGHTFPDHYDQARWDEMDRSVAEHGMHEPILMEYNPWTQKMHLGEGNHRMKAAERAGHAVVPVWGLKTSRESQSAHPVPGEPKVRPEHFHGGYFPSSFKPSDVLPADWMGEHPRGLQKEAVLPGGDLSGMHDARNVEWVRTDKLMPHREWHHGPGWSEDPEGNAYAPRHTAQEWADNAADVKANGIRQPLHLSWDPKSNSAYVTEGNSRLSWAAEAGHEAVPVTGHRVSWTPEHARYKLPGASRGPEIREQSGMNHIPADLRPSSFLPEDYMHSQGKTAAQEKPTKTKAEVNYRRAEGKQRCGNCVMYRPSSTDDELGHCTLVKGLIISSDTCDEWYSDSQKKTASLDEPNREVHSLVEQGLRQDHPHLDHPVEDPAGTLHKMLNRGSFILNPEEISAAHPGTARTTMELAHHAAHVMTERRQEHEDAADRTYEPHRPFNSDKDPDHRRHGQDFTWHFALALDGAGHRAQAEQARHSYADAKVTVANARHARGLSRDFPGSGLSPHMPPDQGDLPPMLDAQHTALNAPDPDRGHRMLELAKNPPAGLRIWRGERRHVDDDLSNGSVGMHWTAKPEMVITDSHREGSDRPVVWQARMEHPHQAIPRSHPIWHGIHQSMPSEAEVRLQPGSSVHVEGAWVGDHTRTGPVFPTHPEHNGPGWTWHPVGRHLPVKNRSRGDTVIDYSQFGIHREASWDTSGSDHSGVYVRFGSWPHNERSYSPAGGYNEDGVSVYDMDKHGNPAIDHGLDRDHVHDEHCDEDCDIPTEEYGNDPKEEMHSRISKAERNRYYGNDNPHEVAHLVRGNMVGVGYDGEPLLHKVKRVGDWIDHRHLFIPGTEPHRLARSPHEEGYEKPRLRHEAAIRQVPSRDGPDGVSKSMMVAIVPPGDVLDHLQGIMKPLRHETEPRAKMHITLLYLGQEDDHPASHLAKLRDLVSQWAKTQQPFEATAQGAGTFANEGSHVLHALVDIPGGHEVHGSLVDFLKGHGLSAIPQNHGWIPHITLAYSKQPVRFMPQVKKMKWPVSEVWYCRGGRWESIPLGRSG